MSTSSSLEDELLLFPHGTVPAISVIHSRLRDLYPSFGLDVCNVVKLTFNKTVSPASPQHTNRFLNFITRLKKNSDYIYYLVVAKAIGYPTKFLNLYRLNVKEKLKSKNGIPPTSQKGVTRLRGLTHRSQEAMKFNKQSSSSSTSSRLRTTAAQSYTRSVSISNQGNNGGGGGGRRERRVSVGRNDNQPGSEFLELVESSTMINTTVPSMNSSYGTGDNMFASPRTSRINSASGITSVLTPNSSSDNLDAHDANQNYRKQSSDPKSGSVVDDAYSSASDSDSDDEDTMYYVALQLIGRFDPQVLIDPDVKSPLTPRRKTTGTRTSNSSRRSPRRVRSASATRNRSDIQDSLKLNLNDTIFKFRNKDDVVELFRAVFD